MANKIKINPETPLVFVHGAAASPPAGTRVNFNVDGLLYGSGYVSDIYDLGAGPRNFRYEWRASALCLGTVIAGSGVDAYIATSDGVYADGNFGTGTSVVTDGEKRRNLQYCGGAVSDRVSAPSASGEPMQAAGIVEIYSRYIQVFWYNATGLALSGTPGKNVFMLTPVPPEIQ